MQQVRLGGATTGSAARQPERSYRGSPTISELDSRSQTQGVIYTPDSTVFGDDDYDEKIEVRRASMEELPSYDESVEGRRSPAARNAPMDNKQGMQMPEAIYQTRSVDDDYHMEREPRSNGVLPTGMTQFQSALTSYREGACCGRGRAKRAAKNVIHEMYAAEMARRQTEKGRLECGERKQIKRDLKPVKQVLKNAVWEAKNARKARC